MSQDKQLTSDRAGRDFPACTPRSPRGCPYLYPHHPSQVTTSSEWKPARKLLLMLRRNTPPNPSHMEKPIIRNKQCMLVRYREENQSSFLASEKSNQNKQNLKLSWPMVSLPRCASPSRALSCPTRLGSGRRHRRLHV